MKAFVESKEVKFDDVTITVYEFSAEQLISIAGRDVSEGEVLLMASDLKAEDVKRLSPSALKVIMTAFKEINPNLYQKTEPDDEVAQTKK